MRKTLLAAAVMLSFFAGFGCKTTLEEGLKGAIKGSLPGAREAVLPVIAPTAWPDAKMPPSSLVPIDEDSAEAKLGSRTADVPSANSSQSVESEVEFARQLIRLHGGERVFEQEPVPDASTTQNSGTGETGAAARAGLKQAHQLLDHALDCEFERPEAKARIRFLLSEVARQCGNVDQAVQLVAEGHDGLVPYCSEDILGDLCQIELDCKTKPAEDLKVSLGKLRVKLISVVYRPGKAANEEIKDAECLARFECVAARIAMVAVASSGAGDAAEHLQRAIRLYRDHTDVIGEYWALRDVAEAYVHDGKIALAGAALLDAFKIAPPECVRFNGRGIVERAKLAATVLRMTGTQENTNLAIALESQVDATKAAGAR